MVTVIVLIALVIFAGGAAAGGILLVSWGIHREEQDFSLTRQAPDRVSMGARVVTGLHVRQRTDTNHNPAGQPDIYA
jgi:hypothetical protein